MKKILDQKYLIILFIISIFLSKIYIDNITQTKLTQTLENKTALAQLEYNTIYNNLKDHALIIFSEIINTKNVINIFTQANNGSSIEQSYLREKLYTELLESYQRLNNLVNLKQLHFHLKNNRSFLRMHKPNKFGDDLTDIRESVKYANKYKTNVYGFEAGRLNEGYRFVFPLFDELKNHIGSVEVSFPAKALVKSIKSDLYNPLFIIKESVVRKKAWSEYSSKFMKTAISDDFVISSSSKMKSQVIMTQDIKDEFSKNSMEAKAYSTYIKMKNRTVIASFIPVRNAIDKELVAYVVLLSNSDSFEHIYDHKLVIQIITLMLLCALFIFYYKNKINNNNIKNSELKYKNLIENIQPYYFFYTHDKNKRFTYISDTITDILGYTKKDFLENHNRYFTNNTLNIDAKKHTQDTLNGIQQKPFIVELYHINGSKKYLEIIESPVYHENGEVANVEGIAKDVTNQLRLDMLIDNSQTIIFYWEAKENWPVEYVSKNIIDFGYTPEEFLTGKIKYSDIIHKDDFKKVSEEVVHYTKEEIDNFTQIYRVVTKDNQVRWIDDRTTIERNDQGEPTYYFGTIIDITLEREAQHTIKRQEHALNVKSNFNTLTNLPNQILIKTRVEENINNLKESKSKLALLSINIDRLKEVNDSFGRAVGDEAIKEIANRLKFSISDHETLAHIGADEFTIVVPETSNELIIDLISKIQESIKDTLIVDDHKLYLSVSMGISIYPDDANCADELIKNADIAVHRAKAESNGSYQFYMSEMTQQAFEHIMLESALRDAVSKNEFVVYYQPQIDASTDKIIGMEALVRWLHPTLGLVPPMKFIPIAEESGIIVDIDRIVMKTAMKEFKSWHDEGYNPGRLALNLSTKQLLKDDLIELLKSSLKNLDFKDHWLELEVTESHMMYNPDESIRVLNEIHDLGINLAIDDFGTGYSSLSYLKKLPIDKLKIDQSFIRDILTDEDDMAIVKSTISLAKSMNLNILAEGVEEVAQKEFLLENGCKNIQGYLYSKPMNKDDMREYLKNF